ncbi:MAG: PilN domain-containing protein [Clostridium sp.]
MKKSINLNPKKLKNEDKNIDVIILLGVIIITACFLGLYVGNSALKLHKIRGVENTLQSEVNNLQTGNLNNNLNSSLSQKNEKIQTLENSIKGFNSYEYLNGIEKAYTEGIVIENVSFNKGIINLEGRTKNESLISMFIEKLKKNKLYKNVQLNLINKIAEEKNSEEYSFTITLNGGNNGN